MTFFNINGANEQILQFSHQVHLHVFCIDFCFFLTLWGNPENKGSGYLILFLVYTKEMTSEINLKNKIDFKM